MELLKNASVNAKDFNGLCRFCLDKTIHLTPIFKNEFSTSSLKSNLFYFGTNADDTNDSSLIEKINLCIGLNITQFDGLPIFICKNCENKLLASYKFRRQCHVAEQILWDALQEKDNYKTDNDDSNVPSFDVIYRHINDEDNKDPTLSVMVTTEPIDGVENSKNVSNNQPKTFTVKRHTKIISKTPKLSDTPTNIIMIRKKRGKYKKHTKDPNKKRKKNPIVQCQICGVFQTNITFHMNKHTGSANYECDFCGRLFSQKNNMYQHMLNRHVTEKIRKFTCNLCPQAFFRKHLLERHMTTHTYIKPFKCDICNRDFRINSDLQRHVLIHTQDRRFKCEICGKMFLSRGGLKNHRGVHTSERPFECGLCPMTFTSSSGASVHRKTHLDGDSYKCHLCDCRMKTWRMLKPHFETHNVENLMK